MRSESHDSPEMSSTIASSRASTQRSVWANLKTFALVLFAAGILRAVVILLLSHNLLDDPDAYRLLAVNLRQQNLFGLTDGKPTAFRPPLYPLLLAPLATGSGLTPAKVGTLHVALGLATVLATGLLARAWGLTRRQVLLAMGLVAVDPLLLYQSTFVMTETVATLLAVSVLGALTWMVSSARSCVPKIPPNDRLRKQRNMTNLAESREAGNSDDMGGKEQERGVVLGGGWWRDGGGGAVAGVCLGLAMLCRPTFLLWVPWILLGLVRFVVAHPRDYAQVSGRVGSPVVGRAIVMGTALLLGLFLTLTPWTARNYRYFGKPIYATTHGGYTLWLANNPYLYEYWRTGPHERVWEATPIDAEQARIFREVGGDELAADREAYSRAWSSIRAEPGMFLYGCLDRWGQLWSPLPHRLEVPETTARWLARWLVAVWYVALYGFAIRGSLRLGGRWTTPPWIFAFGLVAALMTAHVFYWSNIRMRAPLIPVIAMVAVVGMGPTPRRTDR